MTPLQLSEAVEALIKVYAKEKSEEALQIAWQGLVSFWRAVDGAAQVEIDEDGDEVFDPNSGHYRLCYRLLSSFTCVGFTYDNPEGDSVFNTAVGFLVSYLNERNDDRDQFPWGKEGAVAAHGYVAVDLVKGQVIRSDTPIMAEWSMPVRRTEAKIGRNDPCPCGAKVGNKPVKHKRCCGRGQAVAS